MTWWHGGMGRRRAAPTSRAVLSCAVTGQVRRDVLPHRICGWSFRARGVSVASSICAPRRHRAQTRATPGQRSRGRRWPRASSDHAGVRDGQRPADLCTVKYMYMQVSELTRSPTPDIEALVDGAWPQQRLLKNAPVDVDRADLSQLFGQAMSYW